MKSMSINFDHIQSFVTFRSAFLFIFLFSSHSYSFCSLAFILWWSRLHICESVNDTCILGIGYFSTMIWSYSFVCTKTLLCIYTTFSLSVHQLTGIYLVLYPGYWEIECCNENGCTRFSLACWILYFCYKHNCSQVDNAVVLCGFDLYILRNIFLNSKSR